MHTRFARIALFLATILPLLSATGACRDKKKAATAEDVVRATAADRPAAALPRTETPREGAPAGVSEDAAAAATPVPGVPAPIYFEFDSTFLQEESRDTLSHVAGLMVEKPAARVRVIGHTDERGTDEYNLALGAGRAGVARDYLVRLGIAPERIDVVSNGEELPAATGSGEDAWSKNRRDEFELVIEKDRPSAPR